MAKRLVISSELYDILAPILGLPKEQTSVMYINIHLEARQPAVVTIASLVSIDGDQKFSRQERFVLVPVSQDDNGDTGAS